MLDLKWLTYSGRSGGRLLFGREHKNSIRINPVQLFITATRHFFARRVKSSAIALLLVQFTVNVTHTASLSSFLKLANFIYSIR